MGTARKSGELDQRDLFLGIEFFHLEGGHIEPMKPSWKLEEGDAFMQYVGESWRGCMEVIIPAHRVVMIESGVMVWTGAKWTRPWFERTVSAAPFDPVVDGDQEILSTPQPVPQISLTQDQVEPRQPMFPKKPPPPVKDYPVASGPKMGLFGKLPGRTA